MHLPTIPKIGRLSKKHKITAAGAAAAAAVVLTVTGLQATGGASAVAAGDPTGFSVSTGAQVKSLDAGTGMASQRAISDQAAAQKKAADETAGRKKAADDAAVAKTKAEAAAAAKQKAATDAAAKKAADEAAAKRATEQAADDAAAKRATEQAAANRSTHRVVMAPQTTVAPANAPVHVQPVAYSNNLDGWIRQSLSILRQNGVPGSYNGIYRNIMRESSGNPSAINLWDSNATAGTPSKGLLQVIDPTFRAYHVAGTSWNIYDPVANITAACNYAFHIYGSMDNVNSAY